MSDMKPRIVTEASKYEYRYNQTGVMYNEPLVIYNYYTNRGDMGVRVIATTSMKGR